MHIFDISIFGFHIAPTWYWLMYAIGFVICYIFVKKFFTFREKDDIDTLLLYVFFGVLLGGRFGYIFLYNPLFFWENPLEIYKIWLGGMSFHGWLLGVIMAVYIFCRRYKYRFWQLIDTIAVITPIAIGLGRIGNWINGELPWYTPYDGIFPFFIKGVAHFPSPLVEMFLEGIVLWCILLCLYVYRRERFGDSFFSGMFLLWYALARLVAEMWRLPDEHIGYLFDTNWITLGITYTIPMLLVWLYLIVSSRKFQ